MTRGKWCWLTLAVAGLLLPAAAFGAAAVDTKGAVTINAGTNVGEAGEFAASTNARIEEGAAGDIEAGDIVISAPEGFEFDTESDVTALIVGDIDLGEGDGADATATPEADTITFTVANVSEAASTIILQGIRLRALACENADPADTPAVTVTAPGGDLTDEDLVDITIEPGPAVGLTIADIADQAACVDFDVVVGTVDVCDNPDAPVAEDTEVTLALLTGTGALLGEATGTIAADAHTVTIEDLRYNKAEEGVSLQATNGLDAANSNTFNVTAPVATKLVVAEIADQVADIAFEVTVSLQDDCDQELAATATTVVGLVVKTGTGALGGLVERAIEIGSSSVTFSVTYDTVEEGVELTAERVSGLAVADGDSNAFDVGAACVDDAACNDGLFCNGEETCNADTGLCEAGEAPCDLDYCVEDEDVCLECISAADCDNGLFCDGAESCSDEGACVAGTSPCVIGLCDEVNKLCAPCLEDADCDDEDLCTTDTCTVGVCLNEAVDCGDEVCNPEDGGCVECVTADDCPVPADLCAVATCEENACGEAAKDCGDDLCDPETGDCVACLGDEDCEDGDLCTTDTCVDGACESAPVVCDDEDLCTDDACDPETGECVNTAVVCDDGDACTDDACDGETGECVSTAIVCDDEDACTTDECVDGECVFTAIVCDDEDACTTDACVAGECVFTDISCDDGDLCTTDSCADGECVNVAVDCGEDLCDPATGACVACLGDADCDDGVFCNGAEVCEAGECVAGDAACAEDEFCLEDEDRCAECIASATCDDGLFCNGAETCVDGACVAGTPPCDEELGETCNEELDQCEVCFDLFGCGPFCTPVMALTVFGLVALRFTSRRRRA